MINSLFLLGYLVQLAGLLMIIQSRTTGRSRSSWLDAAAVGVATFTIIWSTLYAHLVQSSDSWLDWTTQLGEPVLGVALIAMSLRLAMGERRGFAVFGHQRRAFGEAGDGVVGRFAMQRIEMEGECTGVAINGATDRSPDTGGKLEPGQATASCKLD